jgi:hypothetical protein
VLSSSVPGSCEGKILHDMPVWVVMAWSEAATGGKMGDWQEGTDE